VDGHHQTLNNKSWHGSPEQSIVASNISRLFCARQQLARNPIDAAEKYLKNNKNKKQERKQTQYLTRFGNLPTSLGQGREILLIQQPIKFYTVHTCQEGSAPLFDSKRDSEI